MSRVMVINRLDKDELEYELKIRGIGVGSCDEMRHRLAMAIRFEKSGDSLRYPTYPYTFKEDADAVKKKLRDELAKRIDDLTTGKDSSEAIKIGTKFAHVFGRIDHMDAGEDDANITTRAELLAESLTLFDSFLMKLEANDAANRPATGQQIPPGLSIIQSAIGGQVFQAGVRNAPSSSPRATSPVQVASSSTVKMIPPHKWGLDKFTGSSKSSSVSAFFERVEELRLARNVPKEILLESGLDLFGDKAYQFYKECRRRVSCWDDLVEEFRHEYLSANHNEALFDELQKRTQHPSESIGVYLAVMSSYFNRLRCPVAEEAKLSIIMRNLHPFYQDRLRDPLPTTIDELRTLCRRMEARRDAINNYVEPSNRKMNILEKDLAFVEVLENVDRLEIAPTSSNSSNIRQIICYRCNQVGHKSIGCAMPKKIHCFKCNKDGFTTKNCPKCNSEGNGVRRS